MYTIVNIRLFTFVKVKFDMDINSLLSQHQNFKNQTFESRYFSYDTVIYELFKLGTFFGLQEEGESVLGRKIYSLNFGKGTKRILAWSQMHGNETTTTKALFDFFNFISSNHKFTSLLIDQISFKIIPVLNPDGAQAYTRANANQVDLNRDSVHLTQPESKLLRKVFDAFSPDLCLNLHGQRSIFGIKESQKTSAMSFLSPSVNQERSVTAVRKKSMRLIHAINQDLQHHLPNQIGRYDDAYNINCIGDFIQTQGVPTLLFEAGHIDDYQREDTRKWVWYSYLSALNSFIKNAHETGEWEAYFEIPLHEKIYTDILFKNCKIGSKIMDIAIQYEEKLINNKIKFIPKVHKINNLEGCLGHKEMNLSSKQITINGEISSKIPQINEKWSSIKVDNEDILLEQG